MVENGIEYSKSWAENRRSFGDIFFWVKLANTCFPFTYPQALQSIHSPPAQTIHKPSEPAHSPQTSATRPALLFSHSTTRHHSIALRPSDFTRDATLRVNNIKIYHNAIKSRQTRRLVPSRAYRYFKTINRPSASPFTSLTCSAMEQTSRDQQSAQQSFTRAIKKHRDNVCHSALIIYSFVSRWH